MRKSCLFLFLFSLLSFFSGAQSSLCVTGGASVGNNVFAEIGLAKRSISEERHYGVGVKTYTIELRPGKRTIIGPKVGVWGIAMSNPGMGIGLNLAYYTDFDKGSLVFRPEAGIGFESGKIVYGYNLGLVNSEFTGINRHMVAVAFLLKLKDIKEQKK